MLPICIVILYTTLCNIYMSLRFLYTSFLMNKGVIFSSSNIISQENHLFLIRFATAGQ